MSRVAQPVILNDTDIKLLSSITNGSIPASDDAIKRARMILLLNQGLSGKDVASQLDVRENTVSDLRKRFLQKGISCITVAPKSGRRASRDPKEVEAQVDDIIAKAFLAKTPLPSVSEIVELVDAPVLTVRNILKEKKVIQERPRKWNFKSSDGLEVKSVAIAALYLSGEQQVLVLKTSTEEECIELSENGILETRSSIIANRLSKEAGKGDTIMLAEALDAFSQSDTVARRGKAVNAYSYLTSALPLNTRQPHCEYHFFACGAPVVDSAGIAITGVVLHQFKTKEDWLARAESILSILTSFEKGYDAAVKINTGIYQYLKIADARTDVFAWSKTVEQSRVPEEAAGPGTIEFIGKITDENGKVTTVRTVAALPVAAGEFDTSSERTYLKSFDKIEQAVGNVARETMRKVNEQYMLEMAKKKGSK